MLTLFTELKQYYSNIAVLEASMTVHGIEPERVLPRLDWHATIDPEYHAYHTLLYVAGQLFNGSNIILDTVDSYPMGAAVGELSHPDLAYLSALDGVYIDLVRILFLSPIILIHLSQRILYLYRDPSDAAMSAHRRFGQGITSFKSANWQARCTEQSLQMIHNTLPYIACGKSLLLDYGKFVEGPNKYAEQLAMLLGIDADVVRRCTSKIYSTKKGLQAEKIR